MNRIALSAYLPCYNNAATVREAAESLLAQTVPPKEVLVIDDGSMDGSADRLEGLPVRVIRHDRNLGRGAARARGMAESVGELVVCCDATNVLEPTFTEKALAWFDDMAVAGVFGKISQPPARTLAGRWRGRHLFKLDAVHEVGRQRLLSTFGTLVRASAVNRSGGFDASLRHNEDGDLGNRLLAAGFDVVYDPNLSVISIAENSLNQVLERYWRWYAGKDERVSWIGYRRNIVYSVTGMVAADLRAKDPLAAAISLVTPHYQFWKSRISRRRRQPGHPGRS